MAEKALPSLDVIVQRVVGKYLIDVGFPEKISTSVVGQSLHVEVQAQYFRPGRIEAVQRGAIRKAVRAYLEQQYCYVEKREDNPFKPGKKMTVGAHYERKK